MSEPRTDDKPITFRQGVSVMLWTLGVLVVLTLVFYALGYRAKATRDAGRFRPVEHNFDHVTTKAPGR